LISGCVAASWRLTCAVTLLLLLLLLHVLQLLQQGLSGRPRHALQRAQQRINHAWTTTSNSRCGCSSSGCNVLLLAARLYAVLLLLLLWWLLLLVATITAVHTCRASSRSRGRQSRRAPAAVHIKRVTAWLHVSSSSSSGSSRIIPTPTRPKPPWTLTVGFSAARPWTSTKP
jgi:hypothetical protein